MLRWCFLTWWFFSFPSQVIVIVDVFTTRPNLIVRPLFFTQLTIPIQSSDVLFRTQMDPLSFTASLLTIIGTIGVIGNGLRKLIAVRHVPATLLPLNDEVAGLYCIVQAVDFLTRQHAEITHTGAMDNLRGALNQSRSILIELEDLMRNKLTVEDKGGERD